MDGRYIEATRDSQSGYAHGDHDDRSDAEDIKTFTASSSAVCPRIAKPQHLDKDDEEAVANAYFNSHRMMRRYVAEAYIR